MNHAVLVLDLLTYHSPKGNYLRASEYIFKKKKKGFLLMIFFATVRSEHILLFYSAEIDLRFFGCLTKVRADKLVLEMVVAPLI